LVESNVDVSSRPTQTVLVKVTVHRSITRRPIRPAVNFSALCQLLFNRSRLPSYSDSAESIGKDRQFSEHRSEPLDQRQQPHLWHGGDQLVEHAALSEQRMGASLGSV